MPTVAPGDRMPSPVVWPPPLGRTITFAAAARIRKESVTSMTTLSDGSVSLYVRVTVVSTGKPEVNTKPEEVWSVST
jgi:hypothetical protein